MINIKKKILVVDDEKSIVETITAYLEKENFEVLVAHNGKKAIDTFEKYKPDLIILDLMIPEISGEEVCKKIREKSNIPIIMLSAKINIESKLNGFTLGTDDYITKPFSPKELIARVHSIFKRLPNSNLLKFNNNDLAINLDTYLVEKKGKKVNLTPNEYKIISVLAKNSNKTFSRDDLITSLSSDEHDIFERTIDSHIKNIRNKIEDDKFKYIITIRGFGYKFKDN